MSASPSIRGVRRWLPLAGLGLALFLIAFGAKLWAIHHYGADVPIWDQWDGEAATLFYPYFQHTLTVADFFTPHNEHRILFTRLLSLGLLLVNGQWDPRLEMVAGALLHTVAALILFALIARLIGPRLPVFLILVAAFALPFAWENTLAGFQSQFYFLFLFSLLTLALLILTRPWSGGWWAGLATGLAAIFTMGSGFFAAAAATAILLARAIQTPRLWKSHLAAAAGGLTLVLVGQRCTVLIESHRFLRAHSMDEYLDALGKTLAWPNTSHPWLAFLNFFPLAALLILYLRAHAPAAPACQNGRPAAHPPDWRAEEFALALGFWVLLQAAASAFARGAGGIGPASRYMDLLSMGLVANSLCLVVLLARHGGSLPWRPLWPLIFTLWFVVAGVGLSQRTTFEWRQKIPLKKRQTDLQTAAVRGYLATGQPDYLLGKPLFEIPYPEPFRLGVILNAPGIQDILPVSIRRPLNIIPRPEDSTAFTRNGYYPSTAPAPDPDELVCGSYTAQGDAAQGVWESEPLPGCRLPYLKFEIAGYLGETNLWLKCVETESGREHVLRPATPPRESWQSYILPAPQKPFRLVAGDARPDRWFAFKAPRELGAASLLAMRLTAWGATLFWSGWIVLAFTLLPPWLRPDDAAT